MSGKKKSGKRRRRKATPVAQLIGSMAIRMLVEDQQAAAGELYQVVEVDPTEQHSGGSVKVRGSLLECTEWLTAAPSGRLYVLAQLRAVKGFAK